jgi:hypothetical protein
VLRQVRGILSPILLNVYINGWIEEQEYSDYSGYVRRTFFDCIVNVDNMSHLSLSVIELRSRPRPIYTRYICNIRWYTDCCKTAIMSVGHNLAQKLVMLTVIQPITSVDNC